VRVSDNPPKDYLLSSRVRKKRASLWMKVRTEIVR